MLKKIKDVLWHVIVETGSEALMIQSWNPATYVENGSFVPALGAAVLDWLAPQPGERILYLGCGDGQLTSKIVEAGATVVGIDASGAMVEGAKRNGIDARFMNVEALPFDAEFDAVFSNAALHWVRNQDTMMAGVRRALKPGGRFVAEMGGHGNIAAVQVAIALVLARYGFETAFGAEQMNYFPSPESGQGSIGMVFLSSESNSFPGQHLWQPPACAASLRHFAEV